MASLGNEIIVRILTKELLNNSEHEAEYFDIAFEIEIMKETISVTKRYNI